MVSREYSQSNLGFVSAPQQSCSHASFTCFLWTTVAITAMPLVMDSGTLVTALPHITCNHWINAQFVCKLPTVLLPLFLQHAWVWIIKRPGAFFPFKNWHMCIHRSVPYYRCDMNNFLKSLQLWFSSYYYIEPSRKEPCITSSPPLLLSEYFITSIWKKLKHREFGGEQIKFKVISKENVMML